MREHGLVLSVNRRRFGDVLSAAASAGATSVTVLDAGDFAETGGMLTVNAERVPYTAADDETGVITLATPLVAAAAVDDVVLAGGIEVTAQVLIDDADGAISAVVPHSLRTLLPEGIRVAGTEESVTLELDGSRWRVVDVLGGEPQITASRPIRLETGGATVGQFDEYGGLAATISDFEGDGSGRGVSIYGVDFGDWYAARAGGTIAYGSITPALTAITTETGLFELAVTVDGTRSYELAMYGRITTGTGGVANTHCTVRIRDGGTGAPTTASTLIRTYSYTLAHTGRANSFADSYAWMPTAGTHRLLVSLSATTTADPSFEWGLSVLDMGPVPVNTAVAAGGAEVKQYTSTWTSTGTQVRATGDTTSFSTTSLGSSSSTEQGVAGFTGTATTGETTKTLQTALAGATIQKLEVYLANASFLGASQATVKLGVHSATALPSINDAQVTAASTTVNNWKAGTAKWVTMPSSLHAGFIAGTYRGVIVGPRSGAVLIFNGHTQSKPAKIRVSYTR